MRASGREALRVQDCAYLIDRVLSSRLMRNQRHHIALLGKNLMTIPPTTNAWVTFLKPQPLARLRLFCFPYAGGGASMYRGWQDDLPASIEVCPIQLPGRESRFREPRFTQLAPLVSALGVAIMPYLTKPFAFFGHSLGGIMGFELARFLRHRQGPQPLRLMVSAHRAPQLVYRMAVAHDLPDAGLVQELRRLKGMPDELLDNVDVMEVLIPLLRADFAVAETYEYVPGPSLACSVSAFGGLQDEGVSETEMAAWQQQTTGDFRLHMLPGDHFSVLKDRSPLIKAIINDLQSGLAPV
jgi:medium-chain acyl-[acyl-carrier-protein] hydrolase